MDPKEIIVFFSYIKYKVHFILQAVDVTFKLFSIFNLECLSIRSNMVIYSKFFFSLRLNLMLYITLKTQILSDLKINKMYFQLILTVIKYFFLSNIFNRVFYFNMTPIY